MKTNKRRHVGKLVRWNEKKGFGFIEDNDGTGYVFLHVSALRGVLGIPAVGDVFSFDIAVDDKGRKKAFSVQKNVLAWMRPQYIPRSRKKSRILSLLNALSCMLSIGVAALAFGGKNLNLDSIAMAIQNGRLALASSLSEIARSNRVVHFNPQDTATLSQAVDGIPQNEDKTYFSCRGKVYCKQMASCEEAMFYQLNCPGTKMDGDGDGRPCENRCGH